MTAYLAIAFASISFSARVFWPYFAGVTILVIGLATVLRNEMRLARGMDKTVVFGRALFAAPLAVFGAEHLTAARDIAQVIPPWFPAHLFWTYLVGVALLAAALSIAAKRLSGLAATLLGIMLFAFVLIIHIPGQIANPGNRFLMAVILRDLSFSAGAIALASTEASERWRRMSRRAATGARYVVAVGLLFFGVQHFLHPEFVPVVPLSLKMPAYIPFHGFWAFGVGATLLAGGLCLIANWRARVAAAWLGIVVSAVVLLVYLPILAVNPADIGVALNYFADTLLIGANLLVLASSTPKNTGVGDPRRAAVTVA